MKQKAKPIKTISKLILNLAVVFTSLLIMATISQAATLSKPIFTSLTPSNGATIAESALNNGVTIYWDYVQNATSYKFWCVRVDENGNSLENIIGGLPPTGQVDGIYIYKIPGGKLQYGARYKYRVNAYAGDTYSDSGERYFYTPKKPVIVLSKTTFSSLTPSNGATVAESALNNGVTIYWDYVQNATSYKFWCVRVDENGNSLENIIGGLPPTGQVDGIYIYKIPGGKLQYGARYKYRVNAYAGDTYSDSGERYFYTPKKPVIVLSKTTFSSLTPSNGATVAESALNNGVTIYWDYVQNATSYKFWCVRVDENGNSLENIIGGLPQTGQVDGIYIYKIPGGKLQYGARYKYRVYAYAGDTYSDSGERYFNIKSPPQLSTPIFTSPKDGDLVAKDPRILLTWEKVPNANKYHLEIFEGTKPVINQDISAPANYFTLPNTLNLNYNTTYRVTIYATGDGYPKSETAEVNFVTANEVFYGDVNGDKIIGSTDYAYIQRYIMGILTKLPASDWRIAGDVNLDGVINVIDFAILRDYICGKIPNLPIPAQQVLPPGEIKMTITGDMKVGSVITVNISCANTEHIELSAQNINKLASRTGSFNSSTASWKFTPIEAGTYQITAKAYNTRNSSDPRYKSSTKETTITVNHNGGEKFLIIVSNELVDYNLLAWYSLIQYQLDLIKEGWDPKIITVNNKPDGSAQYVCSTPQALKEVIRSYYNDGYTGFVMIGSHPALQIAWHKYEQYGFYANPCDIYFADMNGVWTTETTEGTNFVCPPKDYKDITPEMFFGRIYIMGSVIRKNDGSYDLIDNRYEEASEVIRYLDKVHKYRSGTDSILTANQESSFYRYAFYMDEDKQPGPSNYTWVADKRMNLGLYLNSQFSSITSNADMSMSNVEDFFDTLNEEGFKAVLIYNHGDIDEFSYNDYYMKYGEIFGYTPKITSEKVRTINTKARVLLLSSCSTSRYCSYVSATSFEHEDDLGKSFLYNSDYLLNIYGETGPTNIYNPIEYPSIFDDATNLCIGKSAQNFLKEHHKSYNKPFELQATLYGDPTIKLKKTKITGSSIPILNNCYNNIEVQAGKLLSLPINISDSDSSLVNIELIGLPYSTPIQIPVSIYNGSGQTTIQWFAPERCSGNWYDVTLRITDDQKNSYLEKYRIYISPINNAMLMDGATGWNIDGVNYRTNLVSTNLTGYSARSKSSEFEVNDGYVKISQQILLEPLREYRLIFYGKIDSPLNKAIVSIGDVTKNVQFDVYDDNNEYENFIHKYFIDFKTGTNTDYPLEIKFGSSTERVNGKFIIAGFKFVPLYWNDFDIDTDISFYSYSDLPSKWNFEESGKLSIDATSTNSSVILDERQFSNFSCEFDVMLSKNQSASNAGLLFRAWNTKEATNKIQGYYVSLDVSKHTIKLERTTQRLINLEEYETEKVLLTEVPFYIEADKEYHLKVSAFNHFITVYVDDMVYPILNYNDEGTDSYLSGRIGLGCSNTHAYFDNIIINGI